MTQFSARSSLSFLFGYSSLANNRRIMFIDEFIRIKDKIPQNTDFFPKATILICFYLTNNFTNWARMKKGKAVNETSQRPSIINLIISLIYVLIETNFLVFFIKRVLFSRSLTSVYSSVAQIYRQQHSC